MKSKLLLILTFIFVTGFSHAQNTKHNITSGKVVFDVSYPDSKLDAQTTAHLPKESIMMFKDEKVKVEVAMPMGSSVIISDNKTGESVVLMDMMGSKWYMPLDKQQITSEKEKYGKPKVEHTRETKQIAGYTCTKAIVTFEDNSKTNSFDAWYTNELKFKNNFDSQIEGITGFMMEFYTSQNGMSMKMTARSVEVKDIDDSEFVIPPGYEKKSMQDLMKSGGQR